MTTETALSTDKTLTAGKATFTLSGLGKSGKEYRWTYRIEKEEREGRKEPFYFVNMLTGPDNNSDYHYIGVYEPQNGFCRTTGKSTMQPNSEPVRALNWFLSFVWSGREQEFAATGWRIQWADRCQRCGRTLTVPSSIDARFGPKCAEQSM